MILYNNMINKYKNALSGVLAAGMLLLCVPDASALTLAIINNNPANDQTFRLASSSPYDGQVLPKSPDILSLVFTQAPRAERSYIKITDMYGTRLDEGSVDVSGNNMAISLPELPAGKYSVRWSARCRCGEDIELGDSFHFTVKPE